MIRHPRLRVRIIHSAVDDTNEHWPLSLDCAADAMHRMAMMACGWLTTKREVGSDYKIR